MGPACCSLLCKAKALNHTAVNQTPEYELWGMRAVEPCLSHGICALRLQMGVCVCIFFFKWTSREEFLFEG